MRKGLLEKIFIGVCLGLVIMSAISAVDHGIKGEYRDMHNSLNWILWIGNTIVMMVLLRKQGVEIEAKDDYIKSLEEYKTLSDDYAVSQKELYQAQKAYSTELEGQIEEYKKLTEDYQKLTEQYKNAKPSRF